MTALSGEKPARGVRYVFTLGEHDDDHALYDVAVQTVEREVTVRVRIEGRACAVEGSVGEVDSAHVAQLVALAKTLAKRDESPWPRRVERWRSPGVR